MTYVDTSVLVALWLREPGSEGCLRWYGTQTDDLISAVWCVTEFASALGIKQRSGSISSAQADHAWIQFERLCAGDLRLLSVGHDAFHRAAKLTRDMSTGLRAGNALHLAVALEAQVTVMATLDLTLAKNAKRMKMKLSVL
ncbi:MAG: type II toxin-antitoxin system VapC family toxin [Pseudomonadota bacterium]